MNQKQIAEQLKAAKKQRRYTGSLSRHVVKSIESGDSNYSVPNLQTYCDDMGFRIIIVDSNTGQRFEPATIEEIHKVVMKLMDRYNLTFKSLFADAGISYCPPAELIEQSFSGKHIAALNTGRMSMSIKTLLGVLNALKSNLTFGSDESSDIKSSATMPTSKAEQLAEYKQAVGDYYALSAFLFGENAPYDVKDIPENNAFYPVIREIAEEMGLDWDTMAHTDSIRVMINVLAEYFNRIRPDEHYGLTLNVSLHKKD